MYRGKWTGGGAEHQISVQGSPNLNQHSIIYIYWSFYYHYLYVFLLKNVILTFNCRVVCVLSIKLKTKAVRKALWAKLTGSVHLKSAKIVYAFYGQISMF